MGTNGITNLVNDLNTLNVEIPKNNDSNGEFAKTFENVSKDMSVEEVAGKDINVVEELKPSENAKSNYLKETNGGKYDNKVDSGNSKNISNKTSDASAKNVSSNNGSKKEVELSEESEEAIENVISAYCEMFNISPEDLVSFMDENNLTVADLMDSSKIQSIVMLLNGITDSVEILTDNDLFDSIKNLEEIADFNLNAISEELSVSKDEALEMIPNDFVESNVTGEEITEIVDHKVVQISGNEKADSDKEIKSLEEESENVKDISVSDNNSKDNSVKKERNEDNGNSQSFMGNNSNEQIQNDLQVTAKENVSFSQNAQEIYDQIGEYVRNLSTETINEVELKLQPETLGTLHIRVSQSEGLVKAEVVTNNENVRNIIEGQLIQLKEDFDRSGIKVDEVEVRVSTNEFNENAQQDSRDEANESAARPSTVRRINLSDGIEIDEIDEYEDDEKIAVEMMAANGNTMDYRA
ncbi:MAG: flagellar hook-length control protein FliK [Lachnospiraceae bacterium]|nr:flagellar hook-length control protein FliK [Lachnospiraceae bacterium]